MAAGTGGSVQVLAESDVLVAAERQSHAQLIRVAVGGTPALWGRKSATDAVLSEMNFEFNPAQRCRCLSLDSPYHLMDRRLGR